jgi:hypothetical protein
MKINFTKKEYRSLIDLLDIANWVINAHRTDIGGEPKDYADLIQKIYSFSKEMGCEDIIEFNKSLGGYFSTREFEENSESREYIEKFEQDTFWAELVAHLADRDILTKFNVRSLSELSPDDRISAMCEAESRWEDEFEKHGLEKICIKGSNE